MAILKPQAPIMNGADYVYPLTTGDQVSVHTGTGSERRLELNGEVLADNSINSMNAEKLGGQAPDYYAKQADVNQLSEQMADYRTAVNLLDNSGFEVAQAGHMGTHGNGVYLADRWHVAYHPEWLIVAKENEGITLTNSGAGFIEIRQPLSDEVINAIDGKPATLAVCYSDKISVVNFTWSSDTNDYSSSLTSNNTGWYAAIFRNNASERIRCRIYSSIAATATIKWVALYEGTYTAETLPPYVYKGYAAELAECQRYYIKIGSEAGVMGYTGGSGTIYVLVPLPQVMRLQNVSLDTGSNVVIVSGGNAKSIDTFTSKKIRANQLELQCAADSSIGVIQQLTGWTSGLGVSADL